MRISVRESDPGYNLQVCRNCSILVDGIDVTGRCHTADEEKGIAMCFKEDMFGHKYVDPDDPDKAAEEVLTGKVVIQILELNGASR